MEFVSLSNISKSYGPKTLINNINLKISKGDRIALIARNGSGKSTLLKIIAGIVAPEGERCQVTLSKNIKLGYLPQEPELTMTHSIFDTILRIDQPKILALRSYLSAMNENDADKIDEAVQLMDRRSAWDTEAKIKELLYRLHLTDFDRVVASMSGGQKKRLAIARLILSEPDLLLLDEPTNHLDIEMIEWLENYLKSRQLTILMVTHDRYFLERICTKILELDRGQVVTYSGNYSDYLQKKALRSQQEHAMRDKAKKLYLKELAWMQRQPKARTTKAKSRISEFHQLEEEVSSITYEDVFKIDIDSSRLGKKILEFYDASKSFEDNIILRNFWYKFKKGERLGICGVNGSGKSTFAELLCGKQSLDSGKRVIGETVQFGYFRQDGMDLDSNKKVIDLIRDIAEYLPLSNGKKLGAVTLLEKFMFKPEQHQVQVEQLSGGEKKRLQILTVLMSNPNFLILDEPTNDLDVLTLNVLEDYLSKFKGCLVVISHDRYFIDKCSDHLFIFEGSGVIKDYNGNYSEWKEEHHRSRSNAAKVKSESSNSSNQIQSVRKLSYLEKKELKDIERELDALNSRKKEIESEFLSGLSDSAAIEKLSIELGDIKSHSDQLEMRWLELAEFL